MFSSSLMPILVEADLIIKWLVYSARRNVLHRATKYVKYVKYKGCRKTNKGETLINMGFEVDLPPGCMRTVRYRQRGGTFYIGRPNMSNMQKMGV